MIQMTPDVQNLLAFLSNLVEKPLPEIRQACAKKIYSMEVTGNPDRQLVEHLKSMFLLIRHLRRPPLARDPEVRQALIDFFTQVYQHDPRAKHVLAVLQKEAPKPKL
ncbi:MAG: hypothetical protein IMW93_06175 [Thermoanaerobacteraceae bacterium]|nr:hypothetical protein [Thermoanaerobacteraceae bacterium]